MSNEDRIVTVPQEVDASNATEAMIWLPYIRKSGTPNHSYTINIPSRDLPGLRGDFLAWELNLAVSFYMTDCSSSVGISRLAAQLPGSLP